MTWRGWQIKENCHIFVKVLWIFSFCFSKMKSVLRYVKCCFDAPWGLKGLNTRHPHLIKSIKSTQRARLIIIKLLHQVIPANVKVKDDKVVEIPHPIQSLKVIASSSSMTICLLLSLLQISYYLLINSYFTLLKRTDGHTIIFFDYFKSNKNKTATLPSFVLLLCAQLSK